MVTSSCSLCNKLPIDNNAIYFDVSSSPTGKEYPQSDRVDEVICIDCLMLWITTKSTVKINLIRRIDNPNLESEV